MSLKPSCRILSVVLTACLLLAVIGSAFAQDLGHTHTSRDGKLTFNYPDGWVVADSRGDFFYITNSQTTLDRITGRTKSADTPLLAGEIVYAIMGPETAELSFEVDPALNAVDAVQARATNQIANYSRVNNLMTAGEVVELTVGSYPAAQITITSPDLEELLVAFKPTADSVIIGQLSTPLGELEPAEAQFRAMLETIRYDSPQPVEVEELTTRYASDDARMTIQMPEGWVGRETYGGYELTVSPEAQPKYADAFIDDSSSVIVRIINPTTLRDSYQAPIDDAQATVVAMVQQEAMSQDDVTTIDLSSDGLIAFGAEVPRVIETSYFLSFMVDGQAFIFHAHVPMYENASLWRDVLVAMARTFTYRTFVAPEPTAAVNWRVLQDPATDMAHVNLTQLALGPNGTLYGMDNVTGAVYTIGTDGTVTPTVPALNFKVALYSSDFAVAPDGTFWVSDSSDYSVHHFGLDGNEIGTIPASVDNTARITRIEFGPDGHLYVLDGVQNAEESYIVDPRIRVFDNLGTQLTEFTLRGKDGGPSELSIAPDGTLYILSYSQFIVADPAGNRLPPLLILRPEMMSHAQMPESMVFAADGTPIVSFEIADYSPDPASAYRSIVKYDADGVAIAAFGQAVPEDWTDAIPEGQLQHVYDMVVLPDGSLIVADGYYPNAQIISTTFAQ